MKTAFISLLVVTALISTGVALVEPQSSATGHLSHKQAALSTPQEHRRIILNSRGTSGRKRKGTGISRRATWKTFGTIGYIRPVLTCTETSQCRRHTVTGLTKRADWRWLTNS